MPELPEVETMVQGLRARIKGRKITDIWADERKLIHHPPFAVFAKQVKGSRVKDAVRRGKIIVMELRPLGFLLFHPKMTGHFLFLSKGSQAQDCLRQKSIHLVFQLDNGYYLAWSDQRKFSRIEYWPVETMDEIAWLGELGEDPLSPAFTFKVFDQLLGQSKARIKSWLMGQKLIAGVGNIYASEILWAAKVSPEKKVRCLSRDERKKIFDAMKRILKQAVADRGTSVAEFRDIDDQKGRYASRLKVYRRGGQGCSRCAQPIKRKVINNRSTYYCPHCQK